MCILLALYLFLCLSVAPAFAQSPIPPTVRGNSTVSHFGSTDVYLDQHGDTTTVYNYGGISYYNTWRNGHTIDGYIYDPGRTAPSLTDPLPLERNLYSPRLYTPSHDESIDSWERR